MGSRWAPMGAHGAPWGPWGPRGCREAADKFVRRWDLRGRSPPRKSSLPLVEWVDGFGRMGRWKDGLPASLFLGPYVCWLACLFVRLCDYLIVIDLLGSVWLRLSASFFLFVFHYAYAVGRSGVCISHSHVGSRVL